MPILWDEKGLRASATAIYHKLPQTRSGIRYVYVSHFGFSLLLEHSESKYRFVKSSCSTTDLTFSGETVEFGTVLIYTCPAACWGEGESYREEYVIVQADPDSDILSSKAEKQHRTDSKVS